jgi:hypothetical protein
MEEDLSNDNSLGARIEREVIKFSEKSEIKLE